MLIVTLCTQIWFMRLWNISPVAKSNFDQDQFPIKYFQIIFFFFKESCWSFIKNFIAEDSMIREKISSEKEAHYLKKKKNCQISNGCKIRSSPEVLQQFLGGDWTDLTLIRLGFLRVGFSWGGREEVSLFVSSLYISREEQLI